jgi:hypothetical protein
MFLRCTADIIIGTMTDRGVVWSNRKDGDSMIVALDGVLTFGYFFTQASPGA